MNDAIGERLNKENKQQLKNPNHTPSCTSCDERRGGIYPSQYKGLGIGVIVYEIYAVIYMDKVHFYQDTNNKEPIFTPVFACLHR